MDRIKVNKIWIQQAEGTYWETSRAYTCISFASADAFLRHRALKAPKDGSYYKTDFRITFEDGYIYEGRFDMEFQHSMQFHLLQRHVLELMTFMNGTRKPAHMRQKDWEHLCLNYEREGYKAQAEEFLRKYVLMGEHDEEFRL